MNHFTIRPYIGALPLRIGMSPEDVASILGPPDDSDSSEYCHLSEARKCVNVGYSHELALNDIIIKPGPQLIFSGVDLYKHDDPITLLKMSDPNPKLFVGFVVFLNLGVRLSGFHDNDDSQKAIAVFARGRYDEYVDDFTPFE